MKKRPLCSPSGWTLTELLVALVITAFLTALGVGTIGTVNRRAKQAKSTQNLRTISTGILQYSAEHNHLPESAITCTYNNQPVTFWFNAIGPYIEGPSYLDRWEKQARRPDWQQCPARPFKTFALHWSRGITVGYGWNHQEFGYDGQDPSRIKYGFAIKLPQVTHPAATIIVGTNREKIEDGTLIPPDATSNLFVYANKPDSSRFDGAGLYLMLDGHVERLTYDEAVANNSYLFRRKK